MQSKLYIFTDGGARGNPGPAACAFVIKDESGKILFQSGKYLGVCTNNTAEYGAIVYCLSWLSSQEKIKPLSITFSIDSLLVVNQLKGLFKVKESHLREFVLQIRQLENQFSIPITYTAIRREKNLDADLLVNQTLDRQLIS